ncbi:RNA recognition motif 2-domain-containing protein [Cercophora newfieldiana]|uniref:RNA recognition motif 2-domain-containing protein n=1 Tax=Cercophora newfieldiana TaxID=92897 RepID=A0AA39Y530_9PEZI|nr:RNA recognition motif 2-domain-containing protein [Cercophora newfieldiana]
MAQAREASFNPPSPHSSTGGADSYKHDGTPDTRLTAFSPDENSARSSKLLKSTNANVSSDSNNVHFHVKSEGYHGAAPGSAEKDPFISSASRSKAEQKLSPTASAFRPVAIPLVANGSGSLAGQSSFGANYSPTLQSSNPSVGTRFSTELGLSRYIVVSSPEQPITSGNVEDYFQKLENDMGISSQGKRSVLPDSGKVYIRLTNVKYAHAVYKCAKIYKVDWCAEYISAPDFYRAIAEGQVRINARPTDSATFDPTSVEDYLISILQREGDIFAFRRLGEQNVSAYNAMVEFEDLDVAVAAASRYNGFKASGVQLWMTLCESETTTPTRTSFNGYSPSRFPINDMTTYFQEMSVSGTPLLGAQTPTPGFASGRPTQHTAGPIVPQHQLAMYPVVYHSHHMPTMSSPANYVLDQTPTRRQTATSFTPMTPISGGITVMSPVYTPPATPLALSGEYTSPRAVAAYGRYDSRRQNAMRVNRSPYHMTAGHHNQVDVNRIRDGIDVRTTIMLRNIPNKVDQAMLKRIIDESSWGKYDFMYLRIDFANDCNVGYAFINFVDPLDIVDFVNARANQRWNCFKSDKVAEISYATIQGKDCLVQKFRNSSVMLEQPHYRPKLYFTSNGPMPDLAGQEEPFPEPDNQSKMKRSCENAEHVGLFTPNAGQHFRDEQRRRRSRYDRGTRLAALEEYNFDDHVQQQAFLPMNP